MGPTTVEKDPQPTVRRAWLFVFGGVPLELRRSLKDPLLGPLRSQSPFESRRAPQDSSAVAGPVLIWGWGPEPSRFLSADMDLRVPA